jgi:hypothetical protein
MILGNRIKLALYIGLLDEALLELVDLANLCLQQLALSRDVVLTSLEV